MTMFKTILMLGIFGLLSLSPAYSGQNQSQIVSIVNERDVVSYTSRKNDQQFLSQLLKSHHGLLDTDNLERLLLEQNYIEVLNCLWSEPDASKRCAWLEQMSHQQHPLLMFELAEEYCVQNPSIETYGFKAFPRLIVAARLTAIDAACSSDRSVSVAASYLLETYQGRIVEQLLEKYTEEDFSSYIKEHDKEYRMGVVALEKEVYAPLLSQEANSVPAPSWVFAHGMSAFTNQPNEISEDQFEAIRRQEAKKWIDLALEKERSLR